ncbi:MAG: hypothetical protein RL477_1500 [Pseudomonadota bacterium]|jgi:PAS domain S-box-containing protein
MFTSRTKLSAIVIGILVLAANWAIFLTGINEEKREIAATTEQQARQASIYFRETSESIFRYADSYARAVRREYVENGKSLDRVRRFMSLFPLDPEIVSHVTIIDETGTPIFLSSGPLIPGLGAGDRDYFIRSRDAAGDAVFISMAERGRNTGKSLLRVVRRLTMPDGSFAGVVFSAVDAERIVDIIRSLGLGPKGLGTLASTYDKTVRARYSDGKFSFGQNIAVSQLWQLLEKAPSGHYVQTSPVDSIERHFYYQKVEGFPLTATVGIAEDDLAARKRLGTRSQYVLALTISLLVVAMVFFTIRQATARETLERATAALRRSEAQLRLVTDNLPAEINFTDRDKILRFANRAYAKRHGFDNPADMIGKSRTEIWGDDDHADVVDGIEETLRGKVTQIERRRTMPDGSVRTRLFTRAPQFDEAGRVIGYVSIGQDISDVKKLEAALAQSQKLEAIGQLTGGIAHDFNNLLAVIMGNAELAMAGDPENNKEVNSIMRAARRGADLTQRLLAFSRRQPLQPRSIHLPELINGMMELVKRTLGETIHVAFNAKPDLPLVMVDPGQLENVILNLAINSRDAMPRGGYLSVELSEVDLDESFGDPHEAVTPGHYVLLEVSDTGVGMSEDVRKRAVEPFFTTKDVGKGSGLGLSMAYGFARQSGGHLSIYSEPGIGTTVKIYLPVAADNAPQTASDALPEAPPFGKGEKILFVEDDPDVLRLVASMLRTLDYRVTSVVNARAALECLERGETFDLLLTDVVLPGGMNGPELAKIAAERWPSMKALFVSGYPAHATSHYSPISDLGDRLLGKPFTRDALARRLRAVLDG